MYLLLGRSKIAHKKNNKKVNNTVLKQERISSNEEDNDEDDDLDDEDEDDRGKKSRKNSENSDSKFDPAMLGLLRVGDDLPKKEKKEPIQLNRRGMVIFSLISLNLSFEPNILLIMLHFSRQE